MFKSIFSLALISFFTLFPFFHAAAAPPSGVVTVSTNTAWPEGNYLLDSLTVENGATLSIAGGSTVNVAGAVSINGASTILVQSRDSGGQVSGQWLGQGATINAAAIQIDVGSKISADGQGYAGNNCTGAGAGPGGGVLNCNNSGNGGAYGGLGAGPNSVSGTIYGSQFQPMALGSGGSGGFQTGSGGAGGGAIRLIVAGTLTNNGLISANGADASNSSGAGSGGSIYITVGALIGSGSFIANGGTSDFGGGGGRVAVYYAANGGFSGFESSTALGSAGGTNGTIAFIDNSQPNFRLKVYKQFFLDPDTTATYDSIATSSGATLSIGGGSNITVLNGITVTGNSTILLQSKNSTGQVSSQWQGSGVTLSTATVLVGTGSKISADGQGYAGNNCSGAGVGPGGGVLHCNNNGNGGSYGGLGAGPNSASGTTYGSQFQPVALGSGGSGGFQSGFAGAGGGAIRLIVSGTLTNNGTISANGGNANGSSGGGSGGSVYVTATNITGSGAFSANGGNSNFGGGGGRVAIYYQALASFDSTASSASAGTGAADGTVIFIDGSQPNSRLTVDKLFILDQDTVATYDSITVRNGATLSIGGGSNITVLNGISVTGNSTILLQSKNSAGQFSGQWQGSGVTLSTATVLVETGSKISADGQGYAGNNCSGAGVGPGGGILHCNNNGNGGSYGGLGAGPNSASGTTYGSPFQPLAPGSGGSGGFQNGFAGAGGGAIRLIVSGTLTNNGAISANGGNASGSSGGGSGGSVYVTATNITGSGAFSANGGNSNFGGGGGRVAIYYQALASFDTTTSSASAGTGAGDGTVIFIDSSQPNSRLTVDKLFILDQETVATYDSITVRNGATLNIGGGSNITVLNGISVTGNSTILMQSRDSAGQVSGQWQGLGATLNATDIQIEAGSKISADGQGYSGNNCSGAGVGPGGGVLHCNNNGNGGSYGGIGSGPNSATMTTYGSQFQPVDLGSGGSGGFQNGFAGAGGGAIRLMVSGTLTNNGTISANGSNASGSSGGGSGGSIYATAATLAGTGIFTANGGTSNSGGGGGRIAVYYKTVSGFNFTTTTATAGTGGGDGTIIFIDNSGTLLKLHVDHLFRFNQDAMAIYDSLTVANGALVTIGGGSDLTFLNGVTVSGNSTMLFQSKDTAGQVIELWQGKGSTISASGIQVDSGSRLSADGQGYAGNSCAGAGAGPGGGPLFCNNGGNGGSYGGKGGSSNSTTMVTYGSLVAPAEPGSGGSGGYQTGFGGAGGGVIRLLVSGTLNNNGTISANGNGASGYSGGGSGGSLFVNTGALSGSGVFTADGGASDSGGGGGRIAVYYLNGGGFSGVAGSTANGGSGAIPGQPGTVLISATTPLFVWLKPGGVLLHDTVRLEGGALGLDVSATTAELVASGNNQQFWIAAQLPILFGLDWDTREVPDGSYELHLVVRDLGGQIVREVTRTVEINNAVKWHSGSIDADETWGSDKIHVVEGTVMVAGGVHLTIAPGAIIKVVDGARIIVANNAVIDALGTTDAHIVFTSANDSSIGRDISLGSSRVAAVPGNWYGISVQGSGLANLNTYTELRYARSDRSGTITSSESWLGTYVYHVTGNIIVPGGVTLTIQPGAVVKFDPFTGIAVQPGGQLIANGTVSQPIYFSSIRDDATGGDTNADGNSTTPAAGDWRWIYIDGAQASFDHVVASYGGGTSSGNWDQTGVIRTAGNAAVSFSNSVVRDARFDGILAWGGTVNVTNSVFAGTDRAICSYPDSTVNVINDTLDGNRVGLLVNGGSMDTVNTLVTNSTAAGVQYISGSLASLRYSDVWTSTTGAVNYSGLADPTGTGGNISASPLFKNRTQGDYRLDYRSPAIDAADGTSALANDFMGAPRYTDPRSPHTGIQSAGSAYPDIGAFEFVETADSDIDLIVTSVSGPLTAKSGDLLNVSWSVTNIGDGYVVGPWHDAIYLVLDPDGSPTEILAGEALVGQNVLLGPGQSHTASATVRVPGSVVGNHRWGVKTNIRGEVYEGKNINNNKMYSLAPVALDLPELLPGASPLVNRFTAVGERHWFKITPGAGKDVGLNLSLSGTTGGTRILVGQGYLPDPQHFDFRENEWNSANTSALITDTSTRTYYVTIYPQSLSGSNVNYTLSARSLDFTLNAVNPGAVSNAGMTTFELSGGQLKGNAVYQIVGPDGVAHNSASIFVEDSTRVYATFNLNGLTPGGYSAQVVEDGKTISAANAFNVVTGSAGQIAYSIEAPSAIRPGWSGQVTINYRNVGNSDAVAPLLRLEATGATFKQIAPQCTGCSPTLQQTYGTIFDSGLLLGINRNGPAGILPPGQSGSITIDMTSTINSGNISFVLHTFNDPNLAFDTAGLKEALRPYYISADAWDAIYANFMAVAGTTVGQFNALLADDATYLSRQGIYEQDIYKLFSFEMYKASQREITRRYTLGSFGRGSSHELDQWGEFRSGNPVIHYPGGTVREFYADPAKANQYLGGVGDYARIALNPADQSLTLSEQNGLEDYFIPDPANPGRYIYEQRKDLNGNVMKLAYIGGRLVSVSDIATGDILSFSYNNQGRINQMTDPVGRTTSYVYDEAGEHLLSLTDSRGTTGYSYVSGQGAALEHALSAITYQDGTHLNFEYDERGRLIRRYRDNNSELMTFSYDANGVTTVSDAAGNRSEILPDLNGRPGQFVDPLGQITRLFYNVENRLVSGISPSGAAISREYDSQGNSSALHDPLGNRTTMTYTSYGRLLSIANSAGSGESFEYDGKYNNTKIIYPDGSYGKYSYDAAGNLVGRTDRRGRKIEFVYDDKRLLTRKNYADGSHVDLAYDSHRNLLSVTGSGSATSFSYDLADRLTGINYPGGRSLRYAYDVGGRRSQVKDGSGFIVNYSYDPAGRLWRVTDGSGSPIVTYGYDASGRLARKEMGNGTYVTHVYDQVGRMLQLTNYRGDGSVISRFEYSYDADGRKIGVSTLDGVWSYAYDNAGQLTTVVKPDRSTISYRYDAAGNRVTLTDNSVVTNYSTHGGDAYSDVGTARYSYDLNGNVVSKVDGVNIWTYSYNDENRLTSMTTPSGNWSYEYDSLGNRVAQTHNGQRSEYLVDPTGMSYVIASFDGSGNLVNHYAYGLDLSAVVDNAGVAAFYHFDDSANTVQVSGAAGAVLNSYSYLPFGEKSVSSETVANPFTFAGRYGVADDGNGLYFMRNRWYDPAVGRFTQPDPVGIAGGDVNLYRYVSNNPVSKIDPVGLQGEQVDYPTIVNIITAPLSQIQGHLSLINDWDELGGKIVGRSGTALNVVGAAVNTATYARTYDEFTHGRSSQAELIHDATVWGTSVVFPFFGKAGSVGSLVVNYVDYGSQFIFLAGSTIAYSEGAKWGPAAIAHFNGLKWDPGAQARTGIIASRDPNDKITVGYGSEGFIAEGAPISYTIDFENVASASAAAQQVVISDTLDANLDWSTLELSQISFNNVTVSVPTGLQSFSGETNVTTDPYPVKVAVTFNPATGQLVWTLQSIDPVTGTLPRDPYAGFLPPNDATRRGQGAVRFTIKPKSGLANGTTISNQASIVFDSNAAITTNKAINTIDTTNPASTVASLSANNITSFTVSWGGSDPGSSGVAYYDVYVSTDGGSFSPWLSGTAQTSGTFTGSVGHSYGFYSIALDNVGNRSAVPSASQAATTVTNLYSVTPSAGIGGSISPATPQSVYQNDNASFTVSAAADYRIDTVTGCGGTLTGSTFTTAAVTADCTVSASFVLKRDGVIDPVSGKTAPDISDALKVYRYVNGLATLTDAEKAHADVAPLGTDWKPLGDGIVDIGDVVIIMRRIVGAVNW